MKTTECRYMVHYNTATQLDSQAPHSVLVPGHLHFDEFGYTLSAEWVAHYKGNHPINYNIQ